MQRRVANTKPPHVRAVDGICIAYPFKMIVLLAVEFRAKPISPAAQSASQNFYALGFLHVARELVFVFARVRDALGFLRRVLVERFDARPDKMRPAAAERNLNLIPKR